MTDPHSAETDLIESDSEFAQTDAHVWIFRRDWFRSEIAVGDKVASPTSIAPMWMRVIAVNDKTVQAVKL